MNFKTIRFLMNGPFFAIMYMVYNFFLFKYIGLLFGGVSNLNLVLLVIIVGFINLASIMIEMKKSNKISQYLMEVSEIWKWASLMYFFDLIAIYLIKIFIPLPQWLIITILAIVPILGIYNYYKAHHIVLKEHELKLANLK